MLEINDFYQLHKISSILEWANLSSVPAFKITGDFNPPSSSSPHPPSLFDLYVVRTRIDSDHVIGVLIEKSQFMAAREFAEVAKVPVAEVTVKEVCGSVTYQHEIQTVLLSICHGCRMYMYMYA